METYFTDQERPGLQWRIQEWVAGVLQGANFASGFTATIRIIRRSSNVLVTTVAAGDVTLADASTNNYAANVTMAKWPATNLTAIITNLGTDQAAEYLVIPYVRQTSDSTDEVPRAGDPIGVIFKLPAV